MTVKIGQAIEHCRQSAILSGIPQLFRLDTERAIQCYPEGGMTCKRYESGIGWCNADREEWDEIDFALTFREEYGFCLLKVQAVVRAVFPVQEDPS